MDIRLLELTLVVVAIYAARRVARFVITVVIPRMERRAAIEVGRNPKWIISQLPYYGFYDVDFVLFKSKLNTMPHFRLNKNKDRIEMWLPEDVTTQDIPELGRLALAGKLNAKYDVWYPDKPIHWLSVLCFMLDGGDINVQEQEVKSEK